MLFFFHLKYVRFRPLTESHFTLNLACLELDETRKSFLESCFVLNSFITYTKPAKDKTNSFVIYTLRVNIMD